MVGGGAAALAVRAPRTRIAYLAVGQIGWVAAGLVTHYRAGIAGSLFLLAAFTVAATCGPAVMGRAEGGAASWAGMGVMRPGRAAGVALAVLSLAGGPPPAGLFRAFAGAAALGPSGPFAPRGPAPGGSVLSLAAAAAPPPPSYVATPPAGGRRGAPLPVLSPP